MTISTGAPVSIFNPLSTSPEFQVNESDSDTTVRVYIRLSPPENVTLTLQRSVDVYLSTSLGTAGSYIILPYCYSSHAIELLSLVSLMR